MFDQIVNAPVLLRKHDIARLTNEEIDRLNFDGMVDVVLASEMAVRNVEGIHNFEGDTIVRLVHMARRHCRKSVVAES